MKKGTFELGGNDAFIVLQEANLEKAVQAAFKSRMMCNAQTGFSAKRFIIEEPVYEEFRERLIQIIQYKTKIGDPLDPRTTLGPIALKRNMELVKQ